MNNKLTTEYDENGRICTKCGVYKIWECFYKSNGNKTGHISCCKKCQSLTIEVSKRRKEYKYTDKSLLDIEKEYKSKENKILGQMKRVKPPEQDIPKRTDRNDYSEPKPYWDTGVVERSGERPVLFYKDYNYDKITR